MDALATPSAFERIADSLQPWRRWPVRMVVGLPLAPGTGYYLTQTPDAHVAMCMVGGVGYGVGLLLPRERAARLVSSFFFAWILIYTATTFLALEYWGLYLGVGESAVVTPVEAWRTTR